MVTSVSYLMCSSIFCNVLRVHLLSGASRRPPSILLARFSAHTGFDDPTSPPDAPPRESLEVRTLVFFPPEE